MNAQEIRELLGNRNRRIRERTRIRQATADRPAPAEATIQLHIAETLDALLFAMLRKEKAYEEANYGET